MPKVLIAGVVLALALSGCASDADDAHTVERMTKTGQCASAASYADQNITDLGLRFYEHAYVFDHCFSDKDAMIAYLSLSARHGSADAQRTLAKLGKPIPAADLRPKPSQSSGDTGATLLLLGTALLDGYNQARPVTTTCFTTGMMTQCQ